MTDSAPLWMLLLIGVLAVSSQVLLLRVSRRIRSKIAKDQPFAGLVSGLVSWGVGLSSVVLWSLTILGSLELFPETEPTSHRLLSLGAAFSDL